MVRPMDHLARLLLAAAATAGLAALGCGTSCEQIQADRAAFLAAAEAPGQASWDAGPHLEIILPFAVGDRLLSERLARRASPRLEGPGIDALGLALGASLELLAARLVPAADDRVGVRLDVLVRDDAEPIVSFRVDAEVRPDLAPEARRVLVWLGPEDVREIAPTLEAGGRERLRRWVLGGLPAGVARFVPERLLEELVAHLVEWLGGAVFPFLRDHLLAEGAATPLIALDLPELPVAGLRLRSHGGPGGALRLDVLTSLPVTRGLATRAPAPAHEALVRISGGAAAAFANRAIAEGLLPSRYDAEGDPAEDGAFEARVGWEVGARPLKVHLWRTGEGCLYARVAGTPRSSLGATEVDVGFSDGVYEVIRGPALTEAFAWTRRLWGPSLALNVAIARAARIAVAGQPIDLGIVGAEIDREEVRVTFAVQHGPGASADGGEARR